MVIPCGLQHAAILCVISYITIERKTLCILLVECSELVINGLKLLGKAYTLKTAQ